MPDAIFLDRDGTINAEHHYVHTRAQWEWLPGAQASIRRFNDAGFKVIVVTNQSGIARGKYTEADMHALHAQINAELAGQGAHIDAFYFCPHHPEFSAPCACRKPLPGMLHQAASEHGINLAQSWLIGDKLSDVDAAHAAGVRSILVETGYGAEHKHNARAGQLVVADLAAACDRILSL